MNDLLCSFCGAERKQTAMLITGKEGDNTAICERCVLLAHEVILDRVKNNINELKAVVLFRT